MNKKENICCPMCFGSGEIHAPRISANSIDKRKIDAAKFLKQKGYSLREITRLLGYKNLNSIRYILNKKSK